MDASIRNICFTPQEISYYTEEFKNLTHEQRKSLEERELMGGAASSLFRLLRIQDSDLSRIWELVSEGRPYLKLQNFMAAMRLCSAKLQSKAISLENMMVDQSVLARKKKTHSASKAAPVEAPEEVKVVPQEERSSPFQDLSLLGDYDNSKVQEQLRTSSLNYNSIARETDLIKESLKKVEQLDFDSSLIGDTIKPEGKAPENDMISVDTFFYSHPAPLEMAQSQITVGKPVLVSAGWFGPPSYHSYKITTKKESRAYTVDRRFSDVEWLHTQLVGKFKGLMIPPLPEKAFVRNKDDLFVEERRKQMESYLNVINKHSVLSTAMAFKVLTQTPNDSFSKTKREAEVCKETLGFVSVEDTVDRVYAHLQSKLQVIFSAQTTPFSQDMNEVSDIINALQPPTEMLVTSFADYCDSNSILNRLLSGLTLQVTPVYSETLAVYRTHLNSHTQERDLLNTYIKEEVLRIKGLGSAIQSYRQTMEEFGLQQNLIVRKLEKHRTSSDLDDAKLYLNQIQATQEKLDLLSSRLKEIETNIKSELKIFQELRRSSLEENLERIVKSEVKYATREKDIWKSASSYINM